MDKPLVSIITITYNIISAGREQSLRQCLESVHAQTYKNIEHIVIDGASTDGTTQLLSEYVKKGWITLKSEKDTGIYNAMNRGVKLAKGTYVAFINSDDYYHNLNGVELSIDALLKSKAAFSYAPVVNFDVKSNTKNILVPNLKHVFFDIVPNHQTMFVKKEVLTKEGLFNEDYKCIGDYDFTLKMCLKNYPSVFVETDFVTYRLGGFSFSATEDGTVLSEITNIYMQNYRKYTQVTYNVAKKIVGTLYCGQYSNLPFALAVALKECRYFDFEEYTQSVVSKKNDIEQELLLLRKTLQEEKALNDNIRSSFLWKAMLKFRKLISKR